MPKKRLENRTIEVILLESNKSLGEKYEIIKAKPAYVRNVLLVKKIAILATSQNKHNYAGKMKAAEESRKKKANNLEDLFMKIQNDEGIKIIRKANKDNTLYAKVDENDIAKTINDIYGIEVEAHLFKLKKKLNQIGTFNVPFLYKNLKKEVLVKIEAEIEEKKKHDEKTEVVEEKIEEKTKKTKEEIKAQKELERKNKKEETIKRLKEKYK